LRPPPGAGGEPCPPGSGNIVSCGLAAQIARAGQGLIDSFNQIGSIALDCVIERGRLGSVEARHQESRHHHADDRA
jgi:hypothetical protein